MSHSHTNRTFTIPVRLIGAYTAANVLIFVSAVFLTGAGHGTGWYVNLLGPFPVFHLVLGVVTALRHVKALLLIGWLLLVFGVWDIGVAILLWPQQNEESWSGIIRVGKKLWPFSGIAVVCYGLSLGYAGRSLFRASLAWARRSVAEDEGNVDR